jgi:exopolysaccharide biosynthesis polyprenyl glycosylphosphotransferase
MESTAPTIITAPAGQQTFPGIRDAACPGAQFGPQLLRHDRARWEGLVSMTAVAGDLVMMVAGFALAFWLRYQSGLVDFANQPSSDALDPSVLRYWKLLLLGLGIMFGGWLSEGFCEYRNLLMPQKTLIKFASVLSICMFMFIGISLAVHTDPPISRLFVICAWSFIFLAVYSWRQLLNRALRHPVLVRRLRKRLVVVGAGPDTLRIKQELEASPELELVGWVQGNKPNRISELQKNRLGSLHELEEILRRHDIDVAVLTESDTLQSEGMTYVAKICEREHVQFKMVPHFFEILISGLRPSLVGGVPVLGVESLPLNSYPNRLVKRTLDVLGASIGLLLACPFILIFGALVYWESPGPILYRQLRLGLNGRLFYVFKIRSMRMSAESEGKAQWAVQDDPRRLKVGAFMRKWNIDEVPQFWNVLVGDMSLVGPRPERPELIERFKFVVPHYQSRHTCRPGMSGWAQVNGWRGNTSLEERIRHDIWYVENWNLLLDLRIMIMTFFCQKNAY